jgi:hypothetical protein
VIYYAKLGISIQRVMTDNGTCYKSRAFGRACKRLGLKHIRTRAYTPKTNGKAQRFIQTALHEWAYAKAYQRSDHRGAELPLWLHRYNWHRPMQYRCQTAHQQTPNRLAMTRTPGLPGVARAFLMRSSISGASRGRPSCLPSLLARLSPARTFVNNGTLEPS